MTSSVVEAFLWIFPALGQTLSPLGPLLELTEAHTVSVVHWHAARGCLPKVTSDCQGSRGVMVLGTAALCF